VIGLNVAPEGQIKVDLPFFIEAYTYGTIANVSVKAEIILNFYLEYI